VGVDYDLLYSGSLLLALVASGLGSFFFDYFLVMRVLRRTANPKFARFAYYCGSISVLAAILSVTIHFVFGHGSEAAEPMRAAEFFIAHKAYWLVAALALLSFIGPAIAASD
jgi:hypothetical protein